MLSHSVQNFERLSPSIYNQQPAIAGSLHNPIDNLNTPYDQHNKEAFNSVIH